MVKEIQFRRGSTSDHISGVGFTGALAEVTVDTTNNTLRVHDGSKKGGHELVGVAATQRLTNKDIEATTFSVGIGTITSATITNLSSSNLLVSTASTIGSAYAESLQVTNDVTVGGDLYVTNNVTIGGTTTQLNTQQLLISDPDIVLGIGTTFSSTDLTANHGGIAVASDEGTPLVNLNIVPGETNPSTYKKIMWFKGSTLGAGITDAWLSNYAVGVGTTQVPNNVSFDAGGQFRVKTDGAAVLGKLYDSVNAVGAAGSILYSTGSLVEWGGLPSAVTSFKITSYASGTGTFTTDSNTLFAQVYVTGGGAGGGGADSDGSAGGAAGGGGAGGTAIKWFTAAQLGASAAYSVGTGGAGGSGNGGSGVAGGNSTFTPAGTGSVLTGNGGSGGTGTGSAYAPAEGGFNGGSGGTATNGDIDHSGLDGGYGIAPSAATLCGGNGGASYHGGGANAPLLNTTGNSVGNNATIPGGGGSGAVNGNTTAARAGGAGADGIIIVVEYLSS